MKKNIIRLIMVLTAVFVGTMAYAQEGQLVDRSSLDEPPTGYVNGLFTVDVQGTQVYFSQGNLQYVGGAWRFAEHQWDCLGDNGQGSASEDAARDLFGWGTSGLDHGAVSYQPWSTSQSAEEYHAYGEAGFNLFDESGEADWGVNGIANGGDVEGLWRVLTREEWDCVFNTRTTASGLRYAKARVNRVNGVILLPDDWEESYHALNDANKPNGKYRNNSVTASEWESDFESHGAVFLPAAGYRFGTQLWYPGKRGSYCSATASGNLHAWNMVFDDTNLQAGTSVSRLNHGFSVRLVTGATDLWYTSVTTGEVTDITSNSATASGTVTTEGGAVLTAVGICWGTDPDTDPTVEGDHTDEGALTGDFTSALANLQRNTTYFVRAYATDGEGDTMYGETVAFTTLAELPAVTTSQVADIAITTATAGGEVTDDGGTEVTECGVCWGTTEELTIDGDHVAAATPGTGAFTVALTGLTQNTAYYVKAYVTNSVGTTYGETMSFTTLRQPWAITATVEPTGSGSVSGTGTYNHGATCTLVATPADGYAFVNWMENDSEVSTNDTLTITVTSAHTLVANFKVDVPEGAINGKFSVREGYQVLFSQGNLQYIGSAGNGDENNAGAYWKFAENQWDILGDNGQGSDSKTVDRDLFGWGTSGYDHGATCYHPWSTSTTSSDYYAYGNYEYNLNDQTGQAEWGYNAISNGGNIVNSGWRTLTSLEWDYLFNTRGGEDQIRYAKACVNGINGMILLPDDWSSSYYALSNTNQDGASFSSNVITAAQWNTLEQHGAVFLPAAGDRSGTSVYGVGSSYGYYWSASYYNSYHAWHVHFYDSYLFADYGNRYYGRSVRLVRSSQDYTFTITASANPTEYGTVNGGGSYTEGSQCTLTATANEGYAFVNWTETIGDDNPKVVSTSATYTFRVQDNRTLVANFKVDVPVGAINGKFSVNANGGKVFFSQGNLQYIGSAGNGDENNTGAYWQFAEHQWDYLGDNGQGSGSKTVDRDLFGWGTSGWNNGNTYYQPWSTASDNPDINPSYGYGPTNGTSYEYNLTGAFANADWGVYNAISNGGGIENSGWRTLTWPEWDYMFYTRTTASGIRYAKACVNNINGVILLPDDWSADYFALDNANAANASFSTNDITIEQWPTLEQHGAVFLPAAGFRGETSVFNVGSFGSYWSASYYDGNRSWDLYFSGPYLNIDCSDYRRYGLSVRLVRPVQ